MKIWTVIAVVAVLFYSSIAQADDPKTLYMHGSQVNLRSKPSSKGTVVGKIGIGTACTLLGNEKRGWVHLKCGELQGYTLGRFLKSDKPELQPLLDQAKATDKPAQERLNSALRAVALKPDNSEATNLLRSTFIEAEFAAMDKYRQDKKTLAGRNAQVKCHSQKDIEACTLKAVEATVFDWHVWKVRAKDFVSVMQRNDQLHVMAGEFKPGDKAKTASISVITARSFKPAPQLGPVLQKGARKGKSSGSPPLDAAALAALKELPRKWYLIRGVPEDPHYYLRCNGSLSTLSKEISLGDKQLYPSASLSEDRHHDTAYFEILAASKSGFRYSLTVRRAGFEGAKGEKVVVSYPHSGKFDFIGYWKGLGSSKNYGVWIGAESNKKQHFRIEQEKNCKDEDGPL
jgi:hypothetical protein